LTSFRKRWSHRLTKRKPQKIEQLRAKACNEQLDEVLDKNDLHDNPGKIWNCDETGIQPCGSSDMVFCEKGITPHKVNPNNMRENTLLICLLTPTGYIFHFMLFKRQKQSQWTGLLMVQINVDIMSRKMDG
jgi:hypothetical protein